MTMDLLQWAQDGTPRVGAAGGLELAKMADIRPPAPNPSRSRPNRGRKRLYIGPALSEPPWDLLRETGYPIPTDVTCTPRVLSRWRQGPRAKVWRRAVFERYGTTCHLCHHEGADSADHLVPLALWGNQPYDPRLSRPAHGVAGCATCGLKCNSSRGHRALAIQIGRYQPPIPL